jgi:hypothetical protein
MKKIMLFATVVAMSLAVAMPVNAQSRKDKKAAKKEAWEMRQQFIKDSTERANKAKLEAMDKAQQAQEEAVKREQAAKEAAAKAAAEAEQHAKMTAVAEMPCQAYDDDEWFYATGAKQFEMKKISQTPAVLLRSTQRQLKDKLKNAYKQVNQDYFDQMETEDSEYAREHIESAGLTVIDQMVNETREYCRKQTAYPDAQGLYTMYMSIRVSKKEIVEKVVNKISKEEELNVRFNENKFRESAFKVFEEKNEKEYNEFKDQQ